MQLRGSTLTVLLALCAAIYGAEAAKKPAPLLVYRYLWSPGFCFSGSSSPVPREFCGFGGESLPRFNAHRAGRLLGFDKAGNALKKCGTPEPFNVAKISPAVRAELECMSNSYTPGNSDGWWEYIWNAEGACTGLSMNKYFKMLVDIFNKYNVDGALANAGLAPGGTISATGQIIPTLERAFGKKGFFTCDRATRSKYSTFSICISPKTGSITQCPAKLVKRNSGCANPMKWEKGAQVTQACSPYYPVTY